MREHPLGRSRGDSDVRPLSWTSFHGVKDIDQPDFRARLDELFMQYPSTDIAKRAADHHVSQVKDFVATIIEANKRGADLSRAAPLAGPAFHRALA